MTRRQRSWRGISLVAVFVFIGSLLVAPLSGFPLPHARAQDDGSAVTPRGPGGGPPVGLATELLLDETRYLFDRLLPLDPTSSGFFEVGRTDAATIYAPSEQPPFDRLLLTLPEGSGVVARYLPQTLPSADDQCPAEALAVSPVDAGESGTFVFAGIEPDLTPEALQEGGTTSEGNPFYIGTEQPFEEFFIGASDGLQRFVRIDDQGLPAILAGEFAFGGRLFSFSGAAGADPANLTRLGCAGPFPVFSVDGETDAPEQLIVQVAGQNLAFSATGEDVATMTTEPTEQEGDEPTPASEASPDTDQSIEPIDATPATDEDAGDQEQATDDAEPTPSPETEEGENGNDEEQETEEGETATTPETDQPIEPTDATPSTDEEDEDAETGNTTGGTPTGEFQREVMFNDARYLFDRIVPISVDEVAEAGEQDGRTIYVRDDATDRIYLANGSDQLARYLAQTPPAGCPTSGAAYDVLDAGETGQFVFAGVEPDLTPDDLQEIGSTPDGQPIYTDGEEPITEFFLGAAEGLLRFILLDDQGLPSTLGTEFPFAGQTFTFAGEATDVDVTALSQIGCATAFPVFVTPEEVEGPFTQLYLAIGTRLFLFQAVEEAPDASPAVTETETVDASPTVDEPTATIAPASPAATEIPTETVFPTEPPTEQPTETQVPTTAPTETVLPTETAAPTETPAPTETIAPTEETSPAVEPSPTIEVTTTASPPTSPVAESPTAVPPTPMPTVAAPADLPQQITVQNTSYVFTQVETSINLSVLVQVEVIQVQNAQLTIYAEQGIQQGVAVRLFAVTENRQVIGQYVPAAVVAPTPPPTLPTSVAVRGVSYVFNEVSVNIDTQTLVQVEVIQVQNASVTVYAERNVAGRPTRLFCVSEDGQVIGLYVDVTVVVKARTTIRVDRSGPATAATLPPGAPPAPAATSVPRSNPCVGDVGPLDDTGVPLRLPRRVQLRGTSYTYIQIASGEVESLIRIGCVGGYEALTSDQPSDPPALFLRIADASGGQSTLFRYEAITTIKVSVQVQGQPRTITLQPTNDQSETSYAVVGSWQRSVYASVTVILYAEEPATANPPLFYGYDVDADVIAEYMPEGEIQEPSEEMRQLAESYGLNADLVINGEQRYILVAVWEPAGATVDGWVTFYSSDQGDRTATVLGRDPRRTDLLIFQRVGG